MAPLPSARCIPRARLEAEAEEAAGSVRVPLMLPYEYTPTRLSFRVDQIHSRLKRLSFSL
jgi:hypothetical protein